MMGSSTLYWSQRHLETEVLWEDIPREKLRAVFSQGSVSRVRSTADETRRRPL